MIKNNQNGRFILEDNSKNILEENNKKKIIKTSFFILIFLGAAFIFFSFFNRNNKNNENIDVDIKTTIEKVLKSSELNTLEYIYGGIAKKTEVSNNEKENSLYSVAYEGTVRIGFDIKNVKVDVDKISKEILFSIPKLEITSAIVDPGSLGTIFNDKRLETDSVLPELLELATKDLEETASNDESLMKIARENSIGIIKALISPFKEVFKDYKFIIN